MYWINFLHIYQPSGQSKEILQRVINESYKPLFEGFVKLKGIKINLNINGALTETLAKKGYQDIIDNIKELAKTGRLEFTESAKYHSLLPFLSKEEIKRQVEKNRETNKKYFGESYKPVCFFPPEMAYSEKVGQNISDLGYKMIILDEISYQGKSDPSPKNYLTKIKGTDLVVAFRERRVSNCIMSAIVRSKKEFMDVLGNEVDKEQYLCTAMDGETFGHHRPGLEKTLFKILESKKPKQIFLSELPNYLKVEEEINPRAATWASSQEDVDKGIQFYSWKSPANKVHKLQWEFLKYITTVAKKKKLTKTAEEKLDIALASDQFFWASGEPWWSIEVIEKGAWALLEALKSFPDLTKEEAKKGENYYREILSIAFWWQRSGKIGQLAKKYKENVKIPFKERTLEDDKPEVYYTFITMMEKKMEEAAKEKNFEKAILWRDAIWKLETKNDIYDAIHAVDLLRREVPDPQLRELMDKYKAKYKKIKPGQPEHRKA